MAKTVFCLTLKDSDEDPLDLGGPCDIWDRHLYSDVAEQSCFGVEFNNVNKMALEDTCSHFVVLTVMLEAEQVIK